MSKAYRTLEEIEQQPLMWKKTFEMMEERRKELEAFLARIAKKHFRVRVIFTGAGTSNYVGDVITPYLKGQDQTFVYESIPTTDIVSNPEEFVTDHPTILVSFARSGNSPESVATVELFKKRVTELYQVVITCAEDGKLAQNAKKDKETLLILLDPKTNDKGFAMTSSFTSMTLAALLLFDKAGIVHGKNRVEMMMQMGEIINERREELQDLASEGFQRVVYLGSGSLAKLAREAQLKILELTAGQIATCFDSSMGFRHGPKSFVDGETLVTVFVSNNPYTAQYDLDIIEELKSDGIAKLVYPISVRQPLDGFKFEVGKELPDAYLALVDVMIAQYLAMYSAIHLENDVDHPSASGTVNRVVKGVTIHPYEKK